MPSPATSPPPTPARRLLHRTRNLADSTFVADALRTETVGGVLLLVAAGVALVWANSPWREAYDALKHLTVGPASLHLQLDLSHWASDGLLAVFFFVAGLELKRELIVGDLSDVQRAVLPVVAAVAGVVVPAALFLAVTAGTAGAARGWAVPTATDIAFALAALAVMGSHLPSGLRSFLLTLAVVDDLIAITIIAVFYTADLDVRWLLAAVVPLLGFGLLAQRRLGRWWLLLPLGLATWGLVHASGVHATVAGVLLALTVPVRSRTDEKQSPAERLEHAVRPFSAGVAVPVFAFFAAGVTFVGGGLSAAVRDPVAWGVVVALVVGKAVGVFGGTWLTARFTRAELDEGLEWGDVGGLSLLAGIGFTVSLLIGELAFGEGSPRDDHVKAAVLAGSLLAAALAALVLRRRDRAYRRLAEADATP
ncbi:Na+/H+ antiporter NhaA [Angustibacter sp. Root456]|uniref:Na+/H+ antiporter NhaA n=1 Tax=Angustibacter sp. Root456 TaxID=1736539 RepID=UPI0006FCDD5A|nr:Na+/H+ antiporter NhaA [Angustibacter sp. Root456]KQX62132.1 sodium:proton antiporter [Angustibacter sp. Root456]